MKLLQTLAIAAMSLTAFGSQAASSYLFDNPENHTYLGARVSLDIASAANGGGQYSNGAGFSVGAVYNIPVYRNLYVEPGLSLFYNTVGTSRWYEVDPDAAEEEGVDPALYQIDGSIRNFGFRIPLLVGYHFDFTEDLKVHVFTGPQLNLSLVSRYHQDAVRVPGYEEGEWSTSLFGTKGFKHADLQWTFGAGLEYGRYYLGLSGAVGITDMKSASGVLDRDLRRNQFAISLGYNF